MLYALLRPALFALDPEASHDLVIKILALVSRWPPLLKALRSQARGPQLPISVMGLEFPNPVGVAAGLDKDARCFPALAALGFGFVELGTVTPQPQPGNPRPRLYRLKEDRALINRMGFNSAGCDQFIANVARLRYRCPVPIGINIGKNASTPIERASEDYVTGLRRVYAYADYVAVNISSPNTELLRELQTGGALPDLLSELQQAREELRAQHGKDVPLAVKLAPDLTARQLESAAEVLREKKIDAVIATNTTTARPAGLRSADRVQEGGLSGAPLGPLATSVTATLYQKLADQIPIIGVGGIDNAKTAWARFQAGADLIQVYSGFIYQGAAIVKNVRQGLADQLSAMQITDLRSALEQARTTTGSGRTGQIIK